jgi:hypothetical protein
MVFCAFYAVLFNIFAPTFRRTVLLSIFRANPVNPWILKHPSSPVVLQSDCGLDRLCYAAPFVLNLPPEEISARSSETSEKIIIQHSVRTQNTII